MCVQKGLVRTLLSILPGASGWLLSRMSMSSKDRSGLRVAQCSGKAPVASSALPLIGDTANVEEKREGENG